MILIELGFFLCVPKYHGLNEDCGDTNIYGVNRT